MLPVWASIQTKVIAPRMVLTNLISHIFFWFLQTWALFAKFINLINYVHFFDFKIVFSLKMEFILLQLNLIVKHY